MIAELKDEIRFNPRNQRFICVEALRDQRDGHPASIIFFGT